MVVVVFVLVPTSAAVLVPIRVASASGAVSDIVASITVGGNVPKTSVRIALTTTLLIALPSSILMVVVFVPVEVTSTYAPVVVLVETNTKCVIIVVVVYGLHFPKHTFSR